MPLTCLYTVLLLAPDALAARLGDRDFRTRERAHRALARLGAWARPALERAARSPDPEAARRAEALLLPWEKERVEARAARIRPSDYPVLPWIGAYDNWDGCPAEIDYYFDRARANRDIPAERVEKDGRQDWPQFREATRLWVIGQLWQRRPEGEIVRQLDLWVQRERAWISGEGQRCVPPARPADWKGGK